MNADLNITIIGAGVVGLAIAAHLSDKYTNIFVIERNSKFGQEISSRNSEVIHSGIYYLQGTLKSKLCLKGRDMLYTLCEREKIPYKNCGKIIVATNDEEIKELKLLKENAEKNGVYDLIYLDTDEIAEKEPNIYGIKALYSPSTGIIDTHKLMKFFEDKSISNSVDFAYLSEVKSINKVDEGYQITINDSENQDFSFTSSIVINTAGLEANRIANMVGINDNSYKIHFCKGEYFSINPPKNRLVTGLVYPVPNKNLTGLGIHATVDLGGGLKLGPNVIFLEKNEYDFKINKSHKEDFFQSTKRFMPFLEKENLQADMAGIRPKLQEEGAPPRDFIIKNETERGFPNFINLIGIESPGLTSCMAIAEYVEILMSIV